MASSFVPPLMAPRALWSISSSFTAPVVLPCNAPPRSSRSVRPIRLPHAAQVAATSEAAKPPSPPPADSSPDPYAWRRDASSANTPSASTAQPEPEDPAGMPMGDIPNFKTPTPTSRASVAENAKGGEEATADPFEKAQNAVYATVNSLFDTFFTPIRAAFPIFSSGWTPASGSFILHPSSNAPAPKSVLHFVGGAFFGAVPHYLYNTLLTRLCARGHVIVATPYNLSFDYLPIADGIARAWEAVEADLATRYGALPVIGVGHSAGSVMHALVASLFEDAVPNAGNILISFNCRSASEAIPSYGALVAPVARAAVAVEEGVPDAVYDNVVGLPEFVDNLVVDSFVTPAAVRDEVLPIARQARIFVEQFAPVLRQIAGKGRGEEAGEEGGDGGSSIGSSRQLDGGVSRDALHNGNGVSGGGGGGGGSDGDRSSRGRSGSEDTLREFYPPPDDVFGAVEQMYSVRETLVVRFENDRLDDSDRLASLLTKCEGASHSVVELQGSHLTPLVQDGPDVFAASKAVAGETSWLFNGALDTAAGVINGVVGAFGIRELTKLEVVIDDWVTAGISAGKL